MSDYRTCSGPHGCGRMIPADLWERAGAHAPGCRVRRSILAKTAAAKRKARTERSRKAAETRRAQLRCADCGAVGERTGHMGCPFPGLRSE